MAEDDIDLDPGLARRLAALNPDVADDGFTANLMMALPERAPPRPAAVKAPSPANWPFALAAALALALLAGLLGSGGAPEPELLTKLDAASTSARALGGALGDLRSLFETHLYTLVAAALCAATLLAPQLLED